MAIGTRLPSTHERLAHLTKICPDHPSGVAVVARLSVKYYAGVLLLGERLTRIAVPLMFAWHVSSCNALR